MQLALKMHRQMVSMTGGNRERLTAVRIPLDMRLLQSTSAARAIRHLKNISIRSMEGSLSTKARRTYQRHKADLLPILASPEDIGDWKRS
jgi:hypothetical protein